MGKGSDAARELDKSGLHADVLDDFKDQLLIVFLKRLGGQASFALKEVDDTGQDLLFFSLKNGVFNFEIRKKD